MTSYEEVSADLPAPGDDGAADHLPGMPMPRLALASTDGGTVDLADVAGRWVLFVYPSTGVPGHALPAGWDDVPGARGCTPEVCGFRDNLAALRDAGIDAVFGLSMQSAPVEAEAAVRLHLPYPLLSDEALELAGSLRLPTFDLHGVTYYRRLSLVVRGSVVEHVFYPVFPTDTHAARVTDWVRANG